MAGVKISALPAIVTPAATDVFPVVQAGVTYKETITQLGTLLLPKSGGTLTGNLTLFGDPTTNLMAATKQYVDNIAAGLNVQPSCVVATTGALTVTYSNGTSGVGATLTNAGAQAAIAIDGVTLSAGQRVLVKNQASTFQNGIYTVTTLGSGATNWVMTRATDYDTAAEITPGDFVLILSGTLNAQTQWVQTATVVTVGTDAITWDQFGADINALIVSIQNNTYVYCEDTGAADAYVATPAPAITAYVEGQVFILDPDNANLTATPTLNVSGLGVKTITNNLGGALVAGDIVASQRLYLLYDGTNFRLINRNYEKRIQNDSFNYILDTGAADAYVATLVPAVTSYVAGQRLSLKIANANATTTPTVNVNALGTKTIIHFNGNALIAGDLKAGMIADLRYDGTNFQLLNVNQKITRINTQKFTGSGTYTPTTGTLYSHVELWAGGAGGGTTNSAVIPGSGGGAGAHSYSFILNPTAVPIVIGAAGLGGLMNNGTAGTDGGDTTYNTTTVVAKGGTHAANAGGGGGAGGLAASGTGDVTFNGGQGSTTPGVAISLVPPGGSSPRNVGVPIMAGFGFVPNVNSGAGGCGGDLTHDAGNGSTGLAIITEYIAA